MGSAAPGPAARITARRRARPPATPGLVRLQPLPRDPSPTKELTNLKTSLGIWAFGSMATRFNPGGYKPESADETTAQRVRRAVAGLGDLMDDYEFHYPQ